MDTVKENEVLREIGGVSIPVYVDDAYLMFGNSIERQVTDFETAINAGPFPVSATGLSYQQVNWLTKDGLLGASEKAGERGWRKFQFREIVYLRVLSELRSFGVGNDALHGLHQLFYGNTATADEIILACLKASETTLLFYSDGTGFVLSPERLFKAEKADDEAVKRSAIRVSISRAVREALRFIGLEPTDALLTLGRMIQRFSLTPKEQEVLDLLRNGNYKEISITKKDGDTWLVHASNSTEGVTVENVIRELLTKDYATIHVAISDGRLVYMNVEDTIKLR